jgi:hypothetical protein
MTAWVTASLPRSRGANAPELCEFPGTLFRKEGARNAGRPMRPQPRVRKCKKHTSESPRKHRFVRRSARDGLSACFVLSPAVTYHLMPSSPWGPGASGFGQRWGAGRIAVATTRLGPPRKAIRMGRISAPVRTAQRRRPPQRLASPSSGLRTRPLYKARIPPPGSRPGHAPRRDAAASTASRPADRDDRETPLSWGGTGVGIWPYGNIVKRERIECS